MTDATVYASKKTAAAAARKALGADAKPNVDFTLTFDGGWIWEAISPQGAPPPKEKAAQSPDNSARAQPKPMLAKKPAKAATAQEKALADAPAKPMPRANAARQAAEASADKGILPPVPDFSADTHKRYRDKLAALQALVEARDLKGLRTFETNPISSSRKILERYRLLSIRALNALAKMPEPQL